MVTAEGDGELAGMAIALFVWPVALMINGSFALPRHSCASTVASDRFDAGRVIEGMVLTGVKG